MPFDPSDLPPLFSKLGPVIADFVKAARRDSPGGKRITPEEWEQIGRDAGILGVEVLEQAGD